MPKSPNIGLELTPRTDTSKKFINYRTEMSGIEEDSNLMIIDGEIKKIHDSIDEHERDKADKAEPSTAGNLAGLDASGNPVDSGKKPSDFANAAHKHGANDITAGTFGVARGGTGAATFPLGNFLRGNNAGAISSIATTDIPPILGRGHAACTTAAGTAVKVATSTGFARSTSAVVGVKFNNANTAVSPSLNVNSTGNAAIINGLTNVPPEEGEMTAGTHFFMFNGTQWVLLNPYSKGGGSAELRVFVAVDTTSSITVTVSKGTVMTQTVNASAEWAIFPIEELGEWEVKVQYGANTYTQKVAVEHIGIFYANPAPLAQFTWDVIIDVARSGLAPKLFKLGDTAAGIMMNSALRYFRIIGFNHDNLADGSGKAPITFFALSGYFGADYSGAQSWEDSNARTTLNNTGYNTYPPNVKAAIVPVLKRSGRRTGTPVVTTDHLFLLSEREMTGGYIQAHADEGSQYEYFIHGNIPLGAPWYWLRSLARDRDGYFVTMLSSGTPGTQTSYSGNSSPHAFCIG